MGGDCERKAEPGREGWPRRWNGRSRGGLVRSRWGNLRGVTHPRWTCLCNRTVMLTRPSKARNHYTHHNNDKVMIITILLIQLMAVPLTESPTTRRKRSSNAWEDPRRRTKQPRVHGRTVARRSVSGMLEQVVTLESLRSEDLGLSRYISLTRS